MRVRRVVAGQERCLQADAARPRAVARGGDRAARGGRRSAQADRSSSWPTSTWRPPTRRRCRSGSTPGSPRLIAERLKPLVEIAGAQDIAGLARGIAFRLQGELRRAAARERGRGDPLARSAGARAAAQVRRALRRLQYLLPDPAEAGLSRAGNRCCGRSKNGAAHGLDVASHARAAARRAHFVGRRSRHARRPSIASPAITCAARARCASTCWSGWRT